MRLLSRSLDEQSGVALIQAAVPRPSTRRSGVDANGLVEDQQGPAAVKLDGLTKVYRAGDAEVTAVREATLAIKNNEFFTLLGPSGCGKTTLLRLIGGFEYPTRGSLQLYGEDIASIPPFRRPINTVFQNYALFPHMTVAENVGFGLRMLRWRKEQIKSQVHTMLRLVRMEHLATRKITQISGGQQQRVALARALAPGPKLLLLDESLSALDYKLRKEMQLELKTLQAKTAITFIFVTHDQEEALTMSDRIAVLRNGEIMQVGTPRDVYNEPVNRFVAGFVGETNILTGRVRCSDTTCALVDLDGIGLMTIPHAELLGHGSQVSVVARPEHITISRQCSQRGPALTGIVSAVSFNGSDTNYRVRLEGSPIDISIREQSRSEEFKTDQQVFVDIRQDAVRLLKD